MKNIDTVILSGGEGKRLKGVVADRPKPMAEVNGRPFLDILIEYASSYGLDRFILCAGHMADYIDDYYRDNKKSGEVIISKEGQPLGTAGAVKNAERFIQSDHFIVMNGDSFCPVDLDKFHDFHFKKGARLSIVVAENEDSGDAGSLVLDEDGRVIQFEEKARQGRALVNAGIYLFERQILSIIPANVKYSLEYELFPGLIGDKFYGFITDKKLIDIGTPDRYEKAKRFLSR